MGLFGKSSDQKQIKCAVVEGDGAFEFPIVGESHYQSELELLAGGRSEGDANHRCAALLIPEPTNPYDKHAVFVQIDGKKVGYLARDTSPEFLEALAVGKFGSAACGAVIVGGWERSDGDTGHFGVKLNAAMPFILREPST